MESYSNQVSEDLKVLEDKLLTNILTKNVPTNTILSHIFSSGGKRIRPSIFLLICDLINYNDDFKYQIASVCEYIHTASLLHDDVIDSSTLRRNKPTVNSIWGDETAVLAGDLIYSASCRIMVKSKNLDLIDTFAECIRLMSESELFQLDLLWNFHVSENDYFKLIYGKTAILFEASAKTPGYIANLSNEVVELLAQFGKSLGLAFQISDDCLDYSATQENLGKPVCADLIEGKVTLPLIFALKQNDTDFNSFVKQIMETGQYDDSCLIKLREFVINSGALFEAQKSAQNHLQRAIDSLTNVLTLHPEYNKQSYDYLIKLSHFVLNRKI